MAETVTSAQGVLIRLTDERWVHITEEHSELAGRRFEILEAVEQPDLIYEAQSGEVFAVKESGPGKFLVVIYREIDSDGFIITAFLTRRMKSLEKRKLVWSAQK